MMQSHSLLKFINTHSKEPSAIKFPSMGSIMVSTCDV